MPQVRISEGAAKDIERLGDFLAEIDIEIAGRAIKTIATSCLNLGVNPQIGRPKGDFRELVIPFGSSGYIVLYLYHEERGLVDVVAIRHQREKTYTNDDLIG